MRSEDYYPELSYAKALELSGISTLYDRRDAIAAELVDDILAYQSHSLHKRLASKYQPSYSLREHGTFIRLKCKTERFMNTFPLSYVYSSWELDWFISFSLYIGTLRTLLNLSF